MKKVELAEYQHCTVLHDIKQNKKAVRIHSSLVSSDMICILWVALYLNTLYYFSHTSFISTPYPISSDHFVVCMAWEGPETSYC